MNKRLSATQWSYFKKQFPIDVEASNAFVIDTGSKIFKRAYSKIIKNKKIQLNDILQEMMEWCDECLEQQYYVERYDEKYIYTTTRVKFHFLDSSDAVLFKMTW